MKKLLKLSDFKFALKKGTESVFGGEQSMEYYWTRLGSQHGDYNEICYTQDSKAYDQC